MCLHPQVTQFWRRRNWGAVTVIPCWQGLLGMSPRVPWCSGRRPRRISCWISSFQGNKWAHTLETAWLSPTSTMMSASVNAAPTFVHSLSQKETFAVEAKLVFLSSLCLFHHEHHDTTNENLSFHACVEQNVLPGDVCLHVTGCFFLSLQLEWPDCRRSLLFWPHERPGRSSLYLHEWKWIFSKESYCGAQRSVRLCLRLCCSCCRRYQPRWIPRCGSQPKSSFLFSLLPPWEFKSFPP